MIEEEVWVTVGKVIVILCRGTVVNVAVTEP